MDELKNRPASEQGVIRTQGGRFAPGTSGNKGGRPKSAKDIQDLARKHSVQALETLVAIMETGKVGEQLIAAKLILERAWGRPGVAEEIGGSGEIIPVLKISLHPPLDRAETRPIR